MKTNLFDYKLPQELIAFFPPKKRDGGRLIVLDPNTQTIEHSHIVNLPEFLPDNSLIIGNNTKVIPARFYAKRPTGGNVEVLFIRMTGCQDKTCNWNALCRTNKPIKLGDLIIFTDEVKGIVEHKGNRGEVGLKINTSENHLRKLLETQGEIPLPPYIKRVSDDNDKHRYQTVFATHEGSVAAPTAGLHFSDELIKKIKSQGHDVNFITLHVGPGTFRPIIADNLDEHEMDEEHFFIEENVVHSVNDAKKHDRFVIAIGTTSVRALEGNVQKNGKLVSGKDSTKIFISPSYKFNIADGLLTNFHLPKSTLICLVSAMAGREFVLKAYKEAVEMRYKFYSYGDAMLILPRIK